jgi:hypothetical protein
LQLAQWPKVKRVLQNATARWQDQSSASSVPLSLCPSLSLGDSTVKTTETPGCLSHASTHTHTHTHTHTLCHTHCGTHTHWHTQTHSLTHTLAKTHTKNKHIHTSNTQTQTHTHTHTHTRQNKLEHIRTHWRETEGGRGDERVRTGRRQGLGGRERGRKGGRGGGGEGGEVGERQRESDRRTDIEESSPF